jgi:selenocysteine lyase/cysteine desulfurase
MGVNNMLDREHEILDHIFKDLENIPNINILAPQHKDRLGVISFYIDDLHYNLGVKLLNDRFGIQTRGGCSCAGTYGHYLLHVDYETSHQLTQEISIGDLVRKPGWIRMSIHPTTTSKEVELVCSSIKALAKNHQEWAKDYNYDGITNEFIHKSFSSNKRTERINKWFDL